MATATHEAPPGAPTNDQLLEELGNLRGKIVTAEAVADSLYSQRMEIYLELRARQVPFADIDDASGNAKGAARAAIAKHRARLRKAAKPPTT
jgi:hypothetical protein